MHGQAKRRGASNRGQARAEGGQRARVGQGVGAGQGSVDHDRWQDEGRHHARERRVAATSLGERARAKEVGS